MANIYSAALYGVDADQDFMNMIDKTSSLKEFKLEKLDDFKNIVKDLDV